MEGRVVIIYHRADYDGIYSGAIMKGVFPQATLVGWDYNDPTPEVSDDDNLVMVDISVKDLMKHPKLLWVDHHKTAIEQFDKTIPGIRVDGVAACRLCWLLHRAGIDWSTTYTTSAESVLNLLSELGEPKLVKLLGVYDVYDQSNEKLFNEAMWLQSGLRYLQIETVDDAMLTLNWIGEKTQGVVASGRRVFEYETRVNRQYAEQHSYYVTLDGKKLLALNSNVRSSRAFGDLVDESCDGYLCWRFTGDAISVSLYGMPGRDVDLSPIAKARGGGGHARACGFKAGLKDIRDLVWPSGEHT